MGYHRRRIPHTIFARAPDSASVYRQGVRSQETSLPPTLAASTCQPGALILLMLLSPVMEIDWPTRLSIQQSIRA